MSRYEHGLRFEYALHLLQAVRYERSARRNDIEYRVGNTSRRSYLDRAGYNLQLGIDTLLLEIAAQDRGVRRSDTLATEILHARIFVTLGYCERYAAAAETQTCDYLDIKAALGHLVQSDDTERGRAVGYDLRDIVIAQVEHLDGEIRRLRQELALGLVDIYADLAQQSDALLIEPALVLNSNSQHNIYFFVRHPRRAPLQHLYPYIRKEAYRQR